MKRIPRSGFEPAFKSNRIQEQSKKIGLVLSGGGARAAYQVGALKALIPFLTTHENALSIIVGSSIGAVNGITLAAGINKGFVSAVNQLEEIWLERNFRNTFSGSPSSAFFRAIKIAMMQYLSPGPNPNNESIFDPTPLMERIDGVVKANGGLTPDNRISSLESIAVMTTVEGKERKPLLFMSSHKKIPEENMIGASFEVYYVDDLSSRHGFASAALPSVLPPVEIDTQHGKVRLVDGGISQNTPVDPAVRMGAEKVMLIDVSGRDWWLKRYGEAQDKRPTWEIPAGLETFCLLPPETSIFRCRKPLGPLLKFAVHHSMKKFMAAVGPTWPVFQLLKQKLGEDIAYETMTYVALDHDYIRLLIETGYNETLQTLRSTLEPSFQQSTNYKDWLKQFVN